MISYLNLISGKIFESGVKVVLVPLLLVLPRSSTFGLRNPPLVALKINLAVLVNFDFELVAQRVDDRRAHAMQSARNLYALFSNLPPACSTVCTTSSADRFSGRMHVDRNSPPLCLDRIR